MGYKTDDEKYMSRCLQLAANGSQFVSPNPMVGSVIVHCGKIIGEGYHHEYGKPHAEVNAINSVKDKALLKYSTIYVSLEPCSHHGKTPPCAQLIIDSKIPKVVIATLDPYHEVSGRGVSMLQNAGIQVEVGVLQQEAKLLNKSFMMSQIDQRPYIYLKWAQTKDGFIDRKRKTDAPACPTPISNDLTKMLVHKLRSEVDAIMVGTNTAIKDNPSLTTRIWDGKNPVRVVLDRNLRISQNSSLFDNTVETIVFTEKLSENLQKDKVFFIPLEFDKTFIPSLLKELNKRKINSLLVEGGCMLLQSFIDAGLWDEAYIEVSNTLFVEGVNSPIIHGVVEDIKEIGTSKAIYMKHT